VQEESSAAAPTQTVANTSGGIMRYEPESSLADDDADPALPPGTFAVAHAAGFDKTERLDGATTCGWERSVEIRRVGARLWIYIHSPGKKNGWGIFVDADEFESAFARIQDAAEKPAFVTTLAA
jgi:hypothetical protein